MTNPPVAERRPHTVIHHGVSIDDPWAWLRDPGYPTVTDASVLAYLNAENDWFNVWAKPRQTQIDALTAELRGRIVEDDASVPARDGAYDYWWRFETGGQYRLWLRRPAGGGDEQLILSEPALAEGHDYFRLGGLTVSPDGRLLAYATDCDGSERFTLKVRDIATGADIATVATNTIGSPVWAADSSALAWTEVDERWRPWRVRLHRLGQGGDDAVLFAEADIGFRVHVSRSQDRSQWLIVVSDHVTSEVHLVPAAAPLTPPRLVSARSAGREYDVDVRGDTLFIRANDTHPNFRIVRAALATPGDWHEVIAASDRHYIRGLTAFTSYLAISERIAGLDQIRLHLGDGRDHYVAFPEASYTASLGTNAEPDAPVLRLGYSSMVTPNTVFDYDVAAQTLCPRKVQQVPSGYDAGAYETLRLTATARDGTAVPVSVVMRRDFPRDGSGKLHLYGYGAYGIAIPPNFSTSRLSLLDRGIAYAIAHVRGGDDLGYQWYLDGKLQKRTNSFTDFVDCANALIAAGLTRAGHISISGGSAGGELMGAVMNSDAALWCGVVAHVPFVDVLNTMLDASLPLTPGEWPEWGNPIDDKAAFDLIASYSPYDNVTAKAYPPALVTAGLNDPRVTYWEPAKWVAKLRATKADSNLLLLKTNMDAGHGGKSGRFDSLGEIAEEYQFLIEAHDAATR